MAQMGGERMKFGQRSKASLKPMQNQQSSVLFCALERSTLDIICTFHTLHCDQILSYNKTSFVKPVISGFGILEEYIQTSHTHIITVVTEFA